MKQRNLPLHLKYRLKDREYACRYLNERFSSEQDSTKKVFLKAVGNVLHSTDRQISEIREQANVSKSHTLKLIKDCYHSVRIPEFHAQRTVVEELFLLCTSYENENIQSQGTLS